MWPISVGLLRGGIGARIGRDISRAGRGRFQVLGYRTIDAETLNYRAWRIDVPGIAGSRAHWRQVQASLLLRLDAATAPTTRSVPANIKATAAASSVPKRSDTTWTEKTKAPIAPTTSSPGLLSRAPQQTPPISPPRSTSSISRHHLSHCRPYAARLAASARSAPSSQLYRFVGRKVLTGGWRLSTFPAMSWRTVCMCSCRNSRANHLSAGTAICQPS